MKKIKFLCGTLLAASVACMAMGVACADKETTEKKGFGEDLTFSAELNETFQTPYLLEGYEYSVQDKDGNPVTLNNGAFFCDNIGDYTIIVVKDGKTYTFPLYVRDTQKPLFAIQNTERISRKENQTIYLDDFFSATDNSGNCSISYYVTRNGLEDAVVGEDGCLTLQYGFYEVTAVAKDPSGNSSEQFLKIQVQETQTAEVNDVISSTVCYLETQRWSSLFSEVNVNDALVVDEDINGFVWNLNTGIDAWCNQFIMIDLDELFGGLMEDVDTVTFKMKLGDAFQSDASKNWVEFYNYYLPPDGSPQLMEGDWIPSEYGDLSYLAAAAMISGMEAEEEYEISVKRAVNQSSTNYLVIRVRCSMGEDGTYNFAPTLAGETGDTLTHDYTITLSDFIACANVFNNGYVSLGTVNVDKDEQIASWSPVANAVSYEVRVGSIEICSDKEVWENIGNVTSYDFSSLPNGTHRFAVRAVFAEGCSAATVTKVRVVDPMIYLFKDAAAGRVNTQLYADGFVVKEDAITLVDFEGKDAIRLDMMPDVADNRNRRDMLIDLEEIYGSALYNIESISFKVYLGNAFNKNSAMNAIELCNWVDYVYDTASVWVNADNPNEPYVIKHLLTGNWVTVNVVPTTQVANARYLNFCVSTLIFEDFNKSWIETYNKEIETGELASDYGVYFADFVATFKTETSIVPMSATNVDGSLISWTAVEDAVGYQIKLGEVDSVWTDIGDVTSFDYSTLGEGYHRYAVRAVFADGSFTAASVGTVKNPTLTEKMFAEATGAVGNWGAPYQDQTGMISLVTFDGKETIKLDMLPEVYGLDNNRVLVIDLEAMYGADLANVASISFKYYLGSGFINGSSCINAGGWWDGPEDYKYNNKNLFLFNGATADINYAYNRPNCTWSEITLLPHVDGEAKYVFFMLPVTSWASNYSGGNTELDYSVYLSDFSVTYAE